MAACKGCGLDIDAAMLFCPHCGRKRDKPTASEEKQGPLRVIPCRVGRGDEWTPAAAVAASDSISIHFLPERRGNESPLTVFLPPTGYLPTTLEATRAAEAGMATDLTVQIAEVSRADLTYVQMEGEELYSLKIQTDAATLVLFLPMDKTYRDLLMKLLGQKLRW